jgi:Ketopantoate reductase PanE/ApbA C terminal
VFSPGVAADRWRELVCNACLGSICAVTGLGTGRVRLAARCVEGLVRLAMEEIVAVAGRKGVQLGEGAVERMIGVDPLEVYLCPCMPVDARKVGWPLFSLGLGGDCCLLSGVGLGWLGVLTGVYRAISSSLRICLGSRCERTRRCADANARGAV